jgi:hypothetical protein
MIYTRNVGMLLAFQKVLSGPVMLLTILCVLASYGCGGKLANPSCATVSQVCGEGFILVHYPDRKPEWKRLRSDNLCKDTKEVAKNLHKPAKVVETVKGSTITFPSGDTFIYQDIPKD